MKYAAVKYRIFGTIADSIINLFAIFIILLLTSTADIIEIFIRNQTASIDVTLLVRLLVAGLVIEMYLIVSTVIYPILTKGSTIGQQLFKIKMVNENGSNCTFLVLFIRQTLGNTLAGLLSFGVTAIISLFLMIYREDNRSIADVLAKTYVIDR